MINMAGLSLNDWEENWKREREEEERKWRRERINDRIIIIHLVSIIPLMILSMILSVIIESRFIAALPIFYWFFYLLFLGFIINKILTGKWKYA